MKEHILTIIEPFICSCHDLCKLKTIIADIFFLFFTFGWKRAQLSLFIDQHILEGKKKGNAPKKKLSKFKEQKDVPLERDVPVYIWACLYHYPGSNPKAHELNDNDLFGSPTQNDLRPILCHLRQFAPVTCFPISHSHTNNQHITIKYKSIFVLNSRSSYR